MPQDLMVKKNNYTILKSSIILIIFFSAVALGVFYYYSDINSLLAQTKNFLYNDFSQRKPDVPTENLEHNIEDADDINITDKNLDVDKYVPVIKQSEDSKLKDNEMLAMQKANDLLLKLFIKFHNNQDYLEEYNELNLITLDVQSKKHLEELIQYRNVFLVNLAEEKTLIFPRGNFHELISKLIVIKKNVASNDYIKRKEQLEANFFDLNSYFHSKKFINDSIDATHNR